MRPKVAVIGAGLAGLAASYFLSLRASVTLFDKRGLGEGTSGISTGLLHPFVGKAALRSWRSGEGMAQTGALLEQAEAALGRKIALRTGVLRIAENEQQLADFKKRSDEDLEAIWWEKEHVAQKIPQAIHRPGIWIPSGITVHSRLYLQGLFCACEKQGVEWKSQEILSLDELQGFDRILVTAGFESPRFPELAHLPLAATKGQTVLCRWPFDPLPCSIVSLGHLTPTEDPRVCQIGSTYERRFSSPDPDPRVAEELKAKAARFYPPAQFLETIEVRSGVRIAPRMGYQPIAERVSHRVWAFTGLGSRGLLYHALLGRSIALQIIDNK